MFLLLSLLLVFAPYPLYTAIIIITIITISEAFLILIPNNNITIFVVILSQYSTNKVECVFHENELLFHRTMSLWSVHGRNINDNNEDDDDNDLRFTHFSSFSFSSFNIIISLPVHWALFGSVHFCSVVICSVSVLFRLQYVQCSVAILLPFCECDIFNNFRVY